MPRVKERNRVEKNPIELLVLYEKELSNIEFKLNGNHISLAKRRNLDKKARRLSEELIPKARNTLIAIAEAAKKFQPV